MKRFFLFLSACLLLLPFVQAQKVGLVLSGGGAKGMTHIGIIRALEENNIPIDYITGTSMGAIIGSLYAMGYSPDDMEALLLQTLVFRTGRTRIRVLFQTEPADPGVFQYPFLL